MAAAHQVVALTLVVTLSGVGLPVVVVGAAESPPPTINGRSLSAVTAAEGRPLTLGGRPFSELLHRVAVGDPVLLTSLMPVQGTGQISGVAIGKDGQPMVNYTVRLMTPAEVDDRGAPQTIRTDFTNADGQFLFAALAPGRYTLEVRDGDNNVGVSTVDLGEGATHVTQLTIEGDEPTSRRFPRVLMWTGIAAGALAGVWALLAIAYSN